MFNGFCLRLKFWQKKIGRRNFFEKKIRPARPANSSSLAGRNPRNLARSCFAKARVIAPLPRAMVNMKRPAGISSTTSKRSKSCLALEDGEVSEATAPSPPAASESAATVPPASEAAATAPPTPQSEARDLSILPKTTLKPKGKAKAKAKGKTDAPVKKAAAEKAAAKKAAKNAAKIAEGPPSNLSSRGRQAKFQRSRLGQAGCRN